MLKSIHQKWKWLTERCLHEAIRKTVVALATKAAQNPKRCIAFISTLSIALAVAGFNTNFQVIVDQDKIFTPFNSLPSIHNQWVQEESGFEQLRPFMMMLHSHGDNVLSAESVRRLFQAYDTLRNTEGVADACAQSRFRNANNENDCRVYSATQFWHHDRQIFERDLSNFTTEKEKDAYVIRALSQNSFPDGTPVFHDAIVGNYEMRNLTTVVIDFEEQDSASNGNVAISRSAGNANATASTAATTKTQDKYVAKDTTVETPRLQTAQSFVIMLDLPNLDERSEVLEERLLARMEILSQQWQQQDSHIALEYFTMYAYGVEFSKAMLSDVPLVGLMFVIMVFFCCFVYADRRNAVQSRSMMGLFSIISIALSLASGYGLVWCIGVPFTNISLMIPFIVVGVGLDDTFIVTGAYFRLSHEQDTVERIRMALEEVGLSIALTTTTTTLAFLLGCASTIPAIRWLCIYGAITIGFVFLYQCTFFIACLVLDERRVQANKRDCCFCMSGAQADDNDSHASASDTSNDNSSMEDSQQIQINSPQRLSDSQRHSYKKDTTKNFSERFMGWYADQLLRPTVKIVVLLGFAAYFVGMIYSTSQLTQQMDVEDFVSHDSHVRSFLLNFEEYSSLFRSVGVYFRNVDQSDPEIQQQMLNYVDELSNMTQIGSPPAFFWLRDLMEMVNDTDSEFAQYNLQDYTFDEQMDVALSLSQVRNVYGGDIVRDPETGEILASRTLLFLRGMVDDNMIKDQITMLQAQREIAMHQPINQGRPKDDLAFFAFDPLFFFWELYAVSVSELVFTTITGVASVSAVAFFMVPHWSAAIFVCGTIMMVYIMLLGTMHIAGLYINVVTYIVIVMAIGLLVDFLMHILLRYYETTGTTRNAKVKETLETMGASILLGGLTTWLGVIPLAFSTTAIFRMVFVSFLAMVSLGCGVGLVLLPVLLSIIGPVVSVQHMTSSQWGEEGEKQLKKSGSPETTTCSSPSFQCSDTSQELSSEITQESCQERNHDMEQGNNFVRRRADDIDQVMSYDANTCASPRGTTVYTIEIADSQDCPIGIECGRGLEI